MSNRGLNYDSDSGFSEDEFYIKVDDKNISKGDVDSTYEQQVAVVKNNPDLTAIPTVNDIDVTLNKLKLDITGNFLEREVLLFHRNG